MQRVYTETDKTPKEWESDRYADIHAEKDAHTHAPYTHTHAPYKHTRTHASTHIHTHSLTEVYQKGPLVIKVWGAKSQKTLWGLWKGEGPSD